MALYFKFHTLDQLEAECRALGLPIHLEADLSVMSAPAQVGGFRVGNRWCIQPMEGCDGTRDGKPGELTLRRYQRFGAGGAKLIWGEAAAVLEEGRANTRQLWIHEANTAAFEEIASTCRRAHRQEFGSDDDLLLGLQLTHSGRYSYARPLLACRDPLLDPLTLINRKTGKAVDDSYPLLSDDYLSRLVDAYVKAASVAFKAGFQFIDLKQCHRYLLNELLAAHTRPGKYGGSLENRTRLARDIIEGIRAEVPGIMIGSRINVFDGIPFQKSKTTGKGEAVAWQPNVRSTWGTRADNPLEPDLTEPMDWLAQMQKLGVVCVNISMGNPYASPHIIRPFEYPPPDGYETPEHPLIGVARHFSLAAQLQRAFPKFPLVGSGYSYLQEFVPQAAAANVKTEAIIFVGVGRASLAQPDFARNVAEAGHLERKRICRTFSYCTALMRSKHNELGQFATGCPPFDKDAYGPMWDEAKKPK